MIGGAIVLLILGADFLLVRRVVRGPINGWTFICALLTLCSLPVIASVLYRMVNLARLRYTVDRNQLVIVTAAAEQIVPMERIERVIDAGAAPLRVRLQSLVWPGCFFGQGVVPGVGVTLFFAADPLRSQLVIVTPSLAYGISAPDRETFGEVFGACQQLGPSAEVEQVSVPAPWTRWPIWHDRVAQGVLLGSTVLCALLFGILCFRYPSLPNLLPMHYDAARQVDRVAPRSEAFVLPVIALIIWAANNLGGILFYRRQRMLSYLAWSGALVVQVFFVLALWNIVT